MTGDTSTKFDPGLFNQTVKEIAKGQDDPYYPDPVEAIDLYGLQTLKEGYNIRAKEKDEWQMPDVESIREQSQPAQRIPLPEPPEI